MKKKIMVLILALALVFTFSACKDKNVEGDPQTGETETQVDDENLGTTSDAQDYIEEGDTGIQYLDTDNLVLAEDSEEYSDDYVAYDFGMKISSSWKVSGALDKLDYSNLEGLKPTLETTLKNSMSTAGLGAFDVWSEFEDYSDDDDDGIDYLVYAMGLEDNDVDKGFCELGAYHNNIEEDNYQYIVYYTKSFTSKDSFDAAYTSDLMKDKFGVTVKESTIKKAVSTVWKRVEETEYDYTVYETKSVKGDNYVEKITFSINAMILEDGTVTGYAAVERERNYN